MESIFNNLEEVKNYIHKNFIDGEPKSLRISKKSLDEVGVFMTIVTDKILEMGYAPNGFKDFENYREYLYIKSKNT